MTTAKQPRRLGFFTRLLDQADAAERYRLATAQIIHAERCGFDSAWVAQHHFHEDEGGLPAPFVFLAQDAVPGNGDWLSHLTAPFDDRLLAWQGMCRPVRIPPLPKRSSLSATLSG